MNFLVLKIILLRNQNDDYRDYVRSRIYIIFLPKSESVDRVMFTKHVYSMQQREFNTTLIISWNAVPITQWFSPGRVNLFMFSFRKENV